MSFVTNSMFLTGMTARRMDAQFAIQQGNQKLLNMIRNPLACSPLESLKKEQQITFASINNQILCKCLDVMEESQKKLLKKNIEKSFDTFA